MKKYLESPWIPMVPGPTISANTLTIEKAPQIIPYPKPETVNKDLFLDYFLIVQFKC